MAKLHTRQELFDKAYLGMVSQNWQRSIRESAGGEQCVYRSPNGMKCAIGYCITDRVYNPGLENSGPYNERVQKAARIRDNDVDFAAQLQTCHDEGNSPDKMQASFHGFAVRYSLTIPEVK